MPDQPIRNAQKSSTIPSHLHARVFFPSTLLVCWFQMFDKSLQKAVHMLHNWKVGCICYLLVFLCFVFFFSELGIKLRALSVQGKCSTTELGLQPACLV
jgi:hypothetical protein